MVLMVRMMRLVVMMGMRRRRDVCLRLLLDHRLPQYRTLAKQQAMIAVVSNGTVTVRRAIRKLRVQGEFSLLLIGAYARRVTVCYNWEVFSRVRKVRLQRRLVVLLPTVISWVTDGFIDIFLSDVG